MSNAWDADAKIVRISTNYPTFYRLTVEDDGRGFSRDAFAELMQGGIGNSVKRADDQPSAARPVIGRLGIGMLGIAQICGSFVITSKMADGRGFRAEVNLFDLMQERVENSVQTSGEYKIVQVGEYEFDKHFDPSTVRVGTTVSTGDLQSTFTSDFQESLTAPAFKEPPDNWNAALKALRSARSLTEMGEYWRLVWELSASAPIPYVSERAVPRSLIKADQRELEGYNFKVIVDNLELRKPVLLRGNPNGYTTFKITEQQFEVYKRRLRFHGYIVVQEGLQLKPDELRGILIRIKNVAIGYYDEALLDYRINQGPRSRWLTGEIFIDEGLEDALNIDRDSFNRFHPQYKTLRDYVHLVLSDKIFPTVYREIDKRSKQKHDARHSARKSLTANVVSDVAAAPMRVESASKKAQASMDGPVIVSDKGGTKLLLPADSAMPVRKTQQQLALAILAVFEVAMTKKNNEEKRRSFRQGLLDLLQRW